MSPPRSGPSLRVLVTGGTGMVGRNIIEHPAMAGHQVLAPGRKELDLLDRGAVEAYLSHERPDVVVHAAGRVGGILANMADPVAFLTENVDIGRNVILGARAAGITRLLNLASSCIYPREAPNPLKEDAILQGALEPTNEGYAIAKIYALKLCEYLCRQDASLAYRSVIPCNLYGRHDHFDPQRGHLLASLIHRLHHAARSGAGEVVMWGDGTARREFMYAGDFAGFIASAIERPASLPMSMNVGVGHDHSIREYYEAVAHEVGFKGSFRVDLSKPVGMRQKLVDSTLVNRWGWRATTPLADGIAEAYEHYQTLPQARP